MSCSSTPIPRRRAWGCRFDANMRVTEHVTRTNRLAWTPLLARIEAATMRCPMLSALVMLAVVGSPASAWALDPAQVLVVANGAVSGSAELATYYSTRRGIPTDHILVIDVPASESIDRSSFERTVEAPIAKWLRDHSALDDVVAIVLCKGMPHRLAGTAGRAGTQASLDSELTLLYRRMVGASVLPQGPTANPYFLGSRPLSDAKPFSRAEFDTFLVTRLDGFTFDDARGLVDRALMAVSRGTFVLDQREGQDLGDRWLVEAVTRLRSEPAVGGVQLDILPSLGADGRAIGFYSWGSSDPALRTRRTSLVFEPGAIGGRFLSTDARTFREPPAEWSPAAWETKEQFFESTPEALVGDLVRDGVTAVSGNVAEPYLDSAVRPDILLPAYARGFSVGEAFYLAMPSLGWQTLVLGDPLTRPFAGVATQVPAVSAAGALPTLDPVTGYPAVFSNRRVDLMRAANVVSRDAARLMVRAERLLTANDVTGAVAALEQATAQDSDFVLAQSMLAGLYELEARYQPAQERYRAILRLRPRDPVALNNLAFSLAERSNRPAEALPLAQQAYALGRGAALIADTLGWVHYKLGDLAKATSFLQEAVAGVPARADIRVRLGLVLAAQQRWSDAEGELSRAKESDPAVEGTEQGRRLGELLDRRSPPGRP